MVISIKLNRKEKARIEAARTHAALAVAKSRSLLARALCRVADSIRPASV